MMYFYLATFVKYSYRIAITCIEWVRCYNAALLWECKAYPKTLKVCCLLWRHDLDPLNQQRTLWRRRRARPTSRKWRALRWRHHCGRRRKRKSCPSWFDSCRRRMCAIRYTTSTRSPSAIYRCVDSWVVVVCWRERLCFYLVNCILGRYFLCPVYVFRSWSARLRTTGNIRTPRALVSCTWSISSVLPYS